jgi:carbamoyltransferase
MKNFINYLVKNLVRDPKKDQITQFHMDIASSIQKVTEEIMIKLAKGIRKEYTKLKIYV